MALSLLFLGFLLGMRHATEADHLAAMATIASRGNTLRQTALQGAAWGIGHTITLFIFGGVALLLGGMIPDNYASLLELLVGLMLIGLGLDMLNQLRKRHIHFHAHSHDDGVRHFHAHAHARGSRHEDDPHQHEHPKKLPQRALLVGLMHGMAGSAALIVLTAQSTENLSSGLLYILLFGLGSVMGMAVLSVVIMLPMRHLQSKGLGSFYRTTQLSIGILTAGLGGLVVFDNLQTLTAV